MFLLLLTFCTFLLNAVPPSTFIPEVSSTVAPKKTDGKNTEKKEVAINNALQETPSIKQPTKKDAPLAINNNIGAPKRTITVTHKITKKMQGYNYYFITYTPNEFTLKANNSLLTFDKPEPIAITNNKLEVTYFCDFKQGNRQSTKTYTLDIDPTTSHVDLTFDWHKEPRVLAQEKSDVAVAITAKA